VQVMRGRCAVVVNSSHLFFGDNYMKKSFGSILFILFLFSCQSNTETLDYDYHFRKGNSYSHEKAWDDAIEEYNRAISISPDIAETHYNLALAYFNKRMEVRDENMKKELRNIFQNERSPDWNPKDNVIDSEDSTTAILLEKEIQELKITVRLDDSISGAHYFLGTNYHNIGKLKESEIELKRTIELDPGYSNSYGVLASVYEKMGKYDSAIVNHKKVLKIDPEDDGTHYDLAMLYHKLGMKKEALKEYEYLKQKNSVLLGSVNFIIEQDQ
jgi:tetratricopeptide (TPR) repeat protein